MGWSATVLREMNRARVVLVHDWLTGMRGGEKVLLELCRLFPAAPLYTLFWNRGSVAAEIEQRVAGVSFLDRLPGVRRGYRNFLPLFPAAVRSLRLPPADLVLSTSHSVALGVRPPSGARHASYIHTPMRYAWGFAAGPSDSFRRTALAALRPWLRAVDRKAAQRVDCLAANSKNVQSRIRKVWRREADVIYPPIDTDFFHPDPAVQREDFYLVAGSLEPYKRADLAIEAFRELGLRLVVAGDGTARSGLEAGAPANVQFLGRVSGLELRRLYRRCRALIFPGLEDLGMVPLEAQACGTPVLAFGAGGALETVREAETGIFFAQATAASVAEGVAELRRREWDEARIRAHAEQFSTAVFRAKLGSFLRSRLGFPF